MEDCSAMEVDTVAAAAAAAVRRHDKDCSYDCNICMGFVKHPVITLCGHLYCWPCIYKCLQAGPYHCSACATPISLNSLIPLYGQDGVAGSEEIPGRPQSKRPMITGQRQDHNPDPYRDSISFSPQLPTAGEFTGGTVALAILRPWVSGYDEPGRGMYYSSNGRVRRQELRIEGLLQQQWVFLFYFALLCLLFF